MNEERNEQAARVVKRGAEREHRDLFASKPLDMGSVKQTLRPSPLPAGFPDESQQLAARNEASVLFTVDALRANNAQNPATPLNTDMPLSNMFVEDDSGVIDLNQLASVPPHALQRAAVAPLFSEPPPAAFASDVDGPAPNSMIAMPGGRKISKRVMAGIGAAAVALVVLSVGIHAAFKGEAPVDRSNATASLMAPVTPVAPTTPAPAASPAATTDPAPASTTTTASNDDDDKSAKPKKGKKAFKGGGAKASFSTPSPKMSTVVAAAPKAPKAADKCGCHGDFQCVIRCSATGK